MKLLELNEKSQKKEGEILTKFSYTWLYRFLIFAPLLTFTKFSYLTYLLPESTKLSIKVMPRHSFFILSADMEIIYFV